MSVLIEVKNLSVEFQTSAQKILAVRDISFTIRKGQTMGLVGESGSGKSVTALSIMRLISTPPGKISSGQIFCDQKDLLSLPEQEIRKIRGNRISMIFQEPMSSLNPVFTVGSQISEVLILHSGMSKKQAFNRSIELLNQVEIDNPMDRIKAYPHQLSGGQRQRVMIAMAIACHPDLLIADEPTTALDVTIQKQIMDLLKRLQKKYSMSIFFITHNLSLIAQVADHVLVMYRGQIVERNSTANLFKNPQHPYTKGLIHCRPLLDSSTARLPVMSDYLDSEGKAILPDQKKWGVKKSKSFSSVKVLLEVKNLKKYFPLQKTFFGKVKSWVKAVDDVSFTIRKGQTMGLVGESGSGKTTLGRVILRLLLASGGEVLYEGVNIMKLPHRQMRLLRKKMQVIFQDPYASLNPRMTIGTTLIEPMVIHRLGVDSKARQIEAGRLMERVGLSADMLNRYPHEFFWRAEAKNLHRQSFSCSARFYYL